MRRSPFFSPSPFFFDHPRTAPPATSSYNRPIYHQYPSRPASVVTIPVRDSSSPPSAPPPARPQNSAGPSPARPAPASSRLDPALAATRIQASFRGFAVRRHKPLPHLRTIASINLQLQDLQTQLQSDRDLPRRVKHDDKERLRLSESIMALLLRLDSIEGPIPEVRSRRKEATRKAVQLQDAIDAMLQEKEQVQEIPPPEVNEEIDIKQEKERIPGVPPAEVIEEMEIHQEKELISEIPAREEYVEIEVPQEKEQSLEVPPQDVNEEMEKQGPIAISIDPLPDIKLCIRSDAAPKDAEAYYESESACDLHLVDGTMPQVLEADLLAENPESVMNNEDLCGEGKADVQQERSSVPSDSKVHIGNVDAILGTLNEQEASLSSSQEHLRPIVRDDDTVEPVQSSSVEAESHEDTSPEANEYENREDREPVCAIQSDTDDIIITGGQTEDSALADGKSAGPDVTNMTQPDGSWKKMKPDVNNEELAAECKRRKVCEQQNADICSLQEEQMDDVGEVEQKEADLPIGMQASKGMETAEQTTRPSHLQVQAESEARSQSGSKNKELSDRAVLEELYQHCLHLRSLLSKLCIQCQKQDKTIASLNSRIGRLERQANSPSKHKKPKSKTRASNTRHN